MDKFEFVNQNYEMLADGGKPKQFTYSAEKEQRKKRQGRMRRLAAAMLALLVIGGAVYIAKIVETPSVSEKVDSGQMTKAGETTGGKNKPTQTEHGAIGLPSDFEPVVLKEGVKSNYKLSLKMKGEAGFLVNAVIKVTNTSDSTWNNLSFYFFPNQFGDMARDQCRRKIVSFAVDKCMQEIGEGETAIEKVAIAGEKTAFELDGIRLNVPLMRPIRSGETRETEIAYTFSLPKNLIEKGIYNPLQWYPMLPGFDKDWLFYPPSLEKETYSTPSADIALTFNLPGNLQAVTSGVDTDQRKTAGTISGENLKEMSVLLLDGYEMKKAKAGGTEIRVFSASEDNRRAGEIIKTALNAVGFFEREFGSYPHKQLDLVITDTRKGSRPGLILQPINIVEDTFYHLPDSETPEHLLVHQIAQQWFYGNVHFERHTDAWLNDGLSELAASLYFMAGQKKNEEESFAFANKYNEIMIFEEGVKANLPADQYAGNYGGITGQIQAKPAIKLWEMLKPHGEEASLEFLAEYLRIYSGKKLATIEFIHFAKEYLKVNNSAFTGWLDYNPYSNYEMSDFYNL
ncbi:hypothetical protein [Bacillus sp. B-jedd]|uniref:hypothetical protein n=1 Tax=Bacillus sp. B-jedd TaxID=1476857 RepID=UPI0005155CE8|nr:hypothetical protein [Bacillus sp. B-jedd]CEG26527.1 hypothetical protein BN1002_01374 [Bacillus sp. B-jedd]